MNQSQIDIFQQMQCGMNLCQFIMKVFEELQGPVKCLYVYKPILTFQVRQILNFVVDLTFSQKIPSMKRIYTRPLNRKH